MNISGSWRDGYVLDYHTVSSTYIGDSPSGRSLYETTRTGIGELMYQFKYNLDDEVLDEIIDVVSAFMESWNPGVTIIVPTPASRSRSRQPVEKLANALGSRIQIPVISDAVVRTKQIGVMKDIPYIDRPQKLSNAHCINGELLSGHRVLLLDDIYDSGSTLNSVTELMYQKGNVSDVYALTMTRTGGSS